MALKHRIHIIMITCHKKVCMVSYVRNVNSYDNKEQTECKKIKPTGFEKSRFVGF